MTLSIRNHNNGDVSELVRDVTHAHPDWVHAQLGTNSESELQHFLDSCDEAEFAKHMGFIDVAGVFMPDTGIRYYVVKIDYVGPNQDQHADDDRIEIRTNPARTNMSHEVKLDGWCGTTNDWAVYAHGEYVTEQAARDYIQETFGPVREDEEAGDYIGVDKDGEPIQAVAVFRPGKYIPMDAEATGNYCWEGIKVDIKADTTDEQIEALVEQYEAEVNEEGYTLDKRALSESMEARRDELKAEAETEENDDA